LQLIYGDADADWGLMVGFDLIRRVFGGEVRGEGKDPIEFGLQSV
jgi:hypothetical protein